MILKPGRLNSWNNKYGAYQFIYKIYNFNKMFCILKY